MAEVAFTKRQKHGAIYVSWEGLDSGDTLQPYEPPTGYDLESVQAIGTFADTDALTLTGSNDEGATFSDIGDAAASADGFIVPAAQAEQYSGSVSATGAGTSDIDVHAYFRARD